MKKTNEWVCGNILVKATITLPDNLAAGLVVLTVAGLTQELQRKPSSAWEKAEAGYDKRPEGFKRNSIPYSEESAERLVELFQAALPNGVEVDFETSEHVGGEQEQSRKMATGLWATIKGVEDDAAREHQLAMIGATEDTTDDDGIELAHAFLGRFRAPAKKKG